MKRASRAGDVKMLATGLVAGILIDATIIRALIVPAVISLMGRWTHPRGRPRQRQRGLALLGLELDALTAPFELVREADRGRVDVA